MSELKIGDIVQLKSGGGPLMTVNALDGEQVSCVWFWDNERRDGVFHQGSVDVITYGDLNLGLVGKNRK